MAFEIPSYQSTARLPGPLPVAVPAVRAPDQPMRSIAEAGRGGLQAARAGEQLAQAGWQIIAEEHQARASDMMSRAREHWNGELVNRRQSAQPGAPDFTPALLRDFDAWASEQMQNAPGGDAGRWLQARFGDLRATLSGEAMNFEARARTDLSARQYADTLDRNRNTVLSNPAQLEPVMQESLTALDGLGLPPIERERLRRETRAGLALSAGQGLINRNPAAAIAAITGPLAQYLDADRSATLLGQARARMDTLAVQGRLAQERQERLAERRLNMAERILGDEAFTRHANGTLTYEWLQQNRGSLNSNDYRALLRSLRGGADFDNPEAVIGLTEQLDTLAPDAFQRAAGQAVRDGTLRTETYRTLIERNRQARRDDQPATAYRQGREFIRDGLDPGVFGDGPQQVALRLARSRALTEYDEWARANPQADPATANTQAEAIVRRYQSFNASSMRMSLPLPYGYAGDRTLIDANAIGEARSRIVDARDRGDLTDAAAAREWQYLDSWEATMQARTPAPRPSGGAAAPASPATPAPAAPRAPPSPPPPPAPPPAAIAPSTPVPDAATARSQREAAIEWLRANDPPTYLRLNAMDQATLLRTLTETQARMRAGSR